MKYQEFKSEYDEQMTLLAKAFAQFPWENAAAYAAWCAQTYHYVCHSTRLLALCAARTPLERNEFHYRFVAHLKEESGHESLAQRDVKELGFKMEDLPCLPQTAAFYQTQYYYVEHVHPFAFFGYVLMLEGAAVTVGADICSRASTAHGPKTVNFLRVHSEEDLNHIKHALAHVEKMTPNEIRLVHENFLNSVLNYTNMLAECGQRAKVLTLRKAA